MPRRKSPIQHDLDSHSTLVPALEEPASPRRTPEAALLDVADAIVIDLSAIISALQSSLRHLVGTVERYATGTGAWDDVIDAILAANCLLVAPPLPADRPTTD